MRPVLHGREPGRLRPRAVAGKTSRRSSTTRSRSSRAARCRCSSRAASRRCRPTSSTRSAMRARSATTPCRRRPTASSSPRVQEFCREAAEGGPALRLSAVRRHRQRRQLAPPGRQPVRRQAAGDRQPARGRRRHRSRHHARQRHQQRPGRPIIHFALDNPKKISFISFQPVSFTGRDEEITDERRLEQRYTLSHLAHDVKNQTGITEPTRDWFPISFMGAFADFADVVHGPDRIGAS